jgi:hypothetical protein
LTSVTGSTLVARDGLAGQVRQQPVGHRRGDREVVAEGVAGPLQHGQGLLDRVLDAVEPGVGGLGQQRSGPDGGRHWSCTPVAIRRTEKARRQAPQRQLSEESP